MMDKIFSGEFSVYNVNGLDVYILTSVEKNTAEIFVRYKDYGHFMFVIGMFYDEFDMKEDAIDYVNVNFTNIMKMYFTEVERIEDL